MSKYSNKEDKEVRIEAISGLSGKIAHAILKIFGWKIHCVVPQEKKFVVIQAPHTSNWDFIWGKLWNFTIDFRPQVLIKKELFFWPLGGILRAFGGVPVDRENRKVRKTDLLVEEFSQRDEFILAITPEGTRSISPNWKTGFYHIAVRAQVPILLGIIDYEKKELGTTYVFYPTGDFQKDFRKIREYYKDKGAKHPEKFTVGNDII